MDDETSDSSAGADEAITQAASDRQPTEGGPHGDIQPGVAEHYQEQAEEGAAQGGKGRVE